MTSFQLSDSSQIRSFRSLVDKISPVFLFVASILFASQISLFLPTTLGQESQASAKDEVKGKIQVVYDSNSMHKSAKDDQNEDTSSVITIDADDLRKIDFNDEDGVTATEQLAQEAAADEQAETQLEETPIQSAETNATELDGETNKDDPSSASDQTSNAASKDVDVLIDMRHAYDFSDFPLTIDDRLYHRIYSFHRAFAYLKSQGVQVEKYEAQAPLDKETLSRCKVLFLNLPSADKEPFLVSEIAAIKDFLVNGGSAFFIVDHTNCYFHQSRLEPLFHELDIEPQFYGICDISQKLGEGNGWIYLNQFDQSPVTQNLREIAFQTGGGVDPRNAVAWSGEQSWQDKPIMPIYGEADVAYYGNFLQDSDEQVGRSGCVLAKQIENGKVVVIGDQNMFSAFFLQYLDNYRLWSNSFAWLLARPELAAPQNYVAQAKSGKLVVCWEDLKGKPQRFGNPDASGYYNVYTNLCRYYNCFCTAHDDSDVGLASDVAVILGGGKDFSEDGVNFCSRQLERGKTLVVLDAPANVLQNAESGLNKALQILKEKGAADLLQKDPAPQTGVPSEKIREEVSLSNGAKIVMIRAKESYNNSSVPAPEGKLLFTQQERIKTLLHAIDDALPSDDADSEEKPEP